MPDQAVAAVDVGEQGPSSISETVCYPDVTTAQQHIVGDAMCPNKENGKKSSRKPRISESVILNDASCVSITLLFSLYRLS